MGFQHESGHEALRFEAEGVSALPAVGGYVLRFSVSYRLPPWKSVYGPTESIFHNFHARAELEPGRLRLGVPVAEVPLVITTHEHAQSGTLAFDLQIPASTIEKIEQLRAGRGLDIKIHISGERVGMRHATQCDEAHYRINQSQWIDILNQMKYGSYLLLEIPTGLAADGVPAEVWALINEGRELIYRGHYRSAVLSCRKALEIAIKHFDIEINLTRAAKLNRDSSRAMTKRERFLNLYESARRAMHLAGHPDANNEVVDYSRREALLILSVIAGAITEINDRAELAGETG